MVTAATAIQSVELAGLVIFRGRDLKMARFARSPERGADDGLRFSFDYPPPPEHPAIQARETIAATR